MKKILEQLGIYGWKIKDENLALATLLTGDPLLLIGSHGAAKTLLAAKMSQALDKKFMAYDASKSLFEDVIGFPNVESLKKGRVEYVPSEVTIWDKEFILIDEINRALPELQSKWLEVIRSRKIMGFPTRVKWVWSAMNPATDAQYNGVQTMDAALVGRFAVFLYPPEALDMEEGDRIKVLEHINGDDAPGLSEWAHGFKHYTIEPHSTKETGRCLAQLLTDAYGRFVGIKEQFAALSEFLSRFSMLVLKETDGKVKLDGRRLGFMYRNLLAYRAVELARQNLFSEPLEDFSKSAKEILLAGIPVGINADGVNKEEVLHKVEICLDLLADYFSSGSCLERSEIVYRLFTCNDLLEKARILLREDLSELAKSKAWNDLADNHEDTSIIAYVALQVEAKRPGTIPVDLLEKLSRCVNLNRIGAGSIPHLKGEGVEFVDRLEAMLQQPSDLKRMIACHRARELAETENVNEETLNGLAVQIEADARQFDELMVQPIK